MAVAYLEDVSSLLALVSAVRERYFKRCIQAERQIVKHDCPFDDATYAIYIQYTLACQSSRRRAKEEYICSTYLKLT